MSIDYIGGEVIATGPFGLFSSLGCLDREMEVYRTAGVSDDEPIVVTVAAAVHHWETQALARLCGTKIYDMAHHRIRRIPDRFRFKHPYWRGTIGDEPWRVVRSRLKKIAQTPGTQMWFRVN